MSLGSLVGCSAAACTAKSVTEPAGCKRAGDFGVAGTLREYHDHDFTFVSGFYAVPASYRGGRGYVVAARVAHSGRTRTAAWWTGGSVGSTAVNEAAFEVFTLLNEEESASASAALKGYIPAARSCLDRADRLIRIWWGLVTAGCAVLALLVAAIFAGVHQQGNTIRAGLRVVLVARRWWLPAGMLAISVVTAWILVNLIFGVPLAGIVATIW